MAFTASGNATISGNVVHITGAGSATITAQQAGDSNYNAAADVSQSFNINAPPSVTILDPVANSILTSSSVEVTLQASDDGGVSTVTVNGVAATLIAGTAQAGTWRATVSVTLPVSVGLAIVFTATATDLQGVSTSATVTVDNDGIDSAIDNQPDVFSNDFTDHTTSNTQGTIATRSGWTVHISDNVLSGVRAALAGAGSGNAIIAFSAGKCKEVRLNQAGEIADMTALVGNSLYVKAVQALSTIEVRKNPSPFSSWVTTSLKTNQAITTGSPFTADADNTEPLPLQLTDDNDVSFGSFELDPGESVDVDFPTEDGVQLSVLAGTVSFTVLGNTFTLAQGETTVINLNPANNAPSIDAITPVECTDTELTFTVAASDQDLDALTYAVSGGAKVTGPGALQATGFSIDTAGGFHWTPGAGQLGQYTFTITVSDGEDVTTQAVIVTTLGVVDGELIIVGTAGNDKIDVKPTAGDPDDLTVAINEKSYHYKLKPKNNPDNPYLGVNLIHVCGLGGDDQINIHEKIAIKAWLEGGANNDTMKGGEGDDLIFGGAGDDTLQGDAGNDLLVGDAGDDTLTGNDGRDLLIGGLGADRLTGTKDDDLLVAGWTSYDANLVALNAVMAEWASAATYVLRIAHLTGATGGLNAGNYLIGSDVANQTVFDDNAVDRLTGSQGTDWFLANTVADNSLVKDILTDLANGEQAADIDLNLL